MHTFGCEYGHILCFFTHFHVFCHDFYNGDYDDDDACDDMNEILTDYNDVVLIPIVCRCYNHGYKWFCDI